MEKIRVLISAPYLQNDIELFRQELSNKGITIDVYPVHERMEEEELLTCIADYHGIICGDDCFTPRVIDVAEQLKVIVKWGTGIDSIDKKYAASKGIPVFNTPDAFTEPVSDFTIAALLSFSCGIHESDRLMKSGKWQKVPGKTLRECTIGIIGFGKIGQAVAKKLQTFGIKIMAHDIRTIPHTEWPHDFVTFTSKDYLLKLSNFVSLNCDLNPTSHHVISADELMIMPNHAVLINTARGPLVDELALVQALQHRQIAGAALDVFESEPLATKSPLRKMNNILLSAHNANASPYHWNRVHRKSIDALYHGLGIEK